MTGDIHTYISFKIGDENFAFDALMVRNIMELVSITSIPNSKEFILGVINLHGNIIPVADLSMMLGLGTIEAKKDTAIIVVSQDDQVESQIGIVVDLVKEVFEVEAHGIQPSAYEGGFGMVDHFSGMVKKGNEFTQIIDLGNLIGHAEK